MLWSRWVNLRILQSRLRLSNKGELTRSRVGNDWYPIVLTRGRQRWRSLGSFRSGALSPDDHGRKSTRRQHLIENAESRREKIINTKLPWLQRTLFAKRVSDVPRDDAEFIEEELVLHFEPGIAHLCLEFTRFISPEVAKRLVKLAVELLIIGNQNYDTAAVGHRFVK